METVKAQNDARFSEVIGRLDTLNGKVDHLPRVGFWQLAGIAASGLVVFFTLLGVFADRFDGGVAASGLMDGMQKEQLARDAAQDAKLDQILESVLVLSNDKKLEP